MRIRRRRPFAREAPVDVPTEQQSPGTTATLHAIATEFYNGLRGLEERDASGAEGFLKSVALPPESGR